MSHAFLDTRTGECVGEVLTDKDGKWWGRRFLSGTVSSIDKGPFEGCQRARTAVEEMVGEVLDYRDATGIRTWLPRLYAPQASEDN